MIPKLHYMMRSLTIRLPEDQLQFLERIARKYRTSKGALIRSLIKSEIEASEDGKRIELGIVLDQRDEEFLMELGRELGIYDASEIVRQLIMAFRVLTRLGLHRILKPIPELAKLAEES